MLRGRDGRLASLQACMHAHIIYIYIYCTAGNFRGVLNFVIFVGQVESQNLMPMKISHHMYSARDLFDAYGALTPLHLKAQFRKACLAL